MLRTEEEKRHDILSWYYSTYNNAVITKITWCIEDLIEAFEKENIPVTKEGIKKFLRSGGVRTLQDRSVEEGWIILQDLIRIGDFAPEKRYFAILDSVNNRYLDLYTMEFVEGSDFNLNCFLPSEQVAKIVLDDYIKNEQYKDGELSVVNIDIDDVDNIVKGDK